MRAEVYWVEVKGAKVAVLPRPRGGEYLKDELRSLRQQGVTVLVSLLTSAEAAELDLVQEERCCAGLGMTFVSFPIDDRGVPASQAVARQVIESLREMHRQGHGVGMHCRYGVGRAPMMAAAFLSALGIPAAEAFGAIAAARGCNVPDTEAQGEWVVRMGAEFGD